MLSTFPKKKGSDCCIIYRNTFTHLCKESGLKQAIYWNCIIFGCYFTYCKSSEIHCKNLEPFLYSSSMTVPIYSFCVTASSSLVVVVVVFFRRCSFFKRGKHKAFKKVCFFYVFLCMYLQFTVYWQIYSVVCVIFVCLVQILYF